jgi:uncharacterized protein (DUF2461 family)
MIDYQSLTNIPEINFKSKTKPAISELADYIDHMKQDLFDDKWSQATKKHIKTSLVLYIRSMQKQLAPMGYHYRADNIESKQHLEHVIPQNRIINAYLHGLITAEQALQMPLCMISDSDKHILEGDWQQSGNWQYPFRRYISAGYTRGILSVTGKQIDLQNHTLDDHFRMLGVTT